MISDLNHIECISLFVEDVAASKKFYLDVFAVKVVFEDENCAVVKLDNLMINLLQIANAPELIEPAKVAGHASGARMMFTVKVENVDEVCAKLRQHGVSLLNGPVDRPWGRRTAAFIDPAGNAWEVAQEL